MKVEIKANNICVSIPKLIFQFRIFIIKCFKSFPNNIYLHNADTQILKCYN